MDPKLSKPKPDFSEAEKYFILAVASLHREDPEWITVREG